MASAGAVTTDTGAILTNLRRGLRWILIGFPLLYVLHGFTPWSYRLWVEEEHRYFWAFWLVVAALHWSSLAAALSVVRRAGMTANSIGLPSLRRLVAASGLLLVFGVLVFAARELIGRVDWVGDRVPVFGVAAPATTVERLVWIPMALTAGICEESVYRGFAILGLRRLGYTLRGALVLSLIAFAFVHGPSAIVFFPVYAVVGLAFAVPLLRTGSLLPGIAAHAAFDMLILLVT